MKCPECDATSFENFTPVMIGYHEWLLEIHTFHCAVCGWVTVQDWKWVDEDEEWTDDD